MYRVCNGNLLYHGCIPMEPDGTFTRVTMGDKTYFGKSLMDACDRLCRTAMYDLSGVSSVDVSNGVARLLGWANDGSSVIQTYSLAGGTPTALGSAALASWPEASAFAGDRCASPTLSTTC